METIRACVYEELKQKADRLFAGILEGRITAITGRNWRRSPKSKTLHGLDNIKKFLMDVLKENKGDLNGCI